MKKTLVFLIALLICGSVMAQNSEKMENKEIYLWLIIANALICYQLSWKWEDYREEFWKYFWKNNPLDPPFQREEFWINKKNQGELRSKRKYPGVFLDELKNFFKNSKNNKRFIDTKTWRIEKLEKSDFFEKLVYSWKIKSFMNYWIVIGKLCY